MVLNKYSIGLFLVIFVSGMLLFNGAVIQDTSSSLNNGYKFDQWRPDSTTLSNDGCSGCHSDLTTNIASSGSLTLTTSTTVNVLSTFTLQASVTGFTEAKSDQIVIGFNGLDANNSLFQVTSSLGQDFQPSITTDGAGSITPVNFTLTAPSTAGNYTLLAYAVHATTTTAFYYLKQTVNVTVTAVKDTTPPVIHSLTVNNKTYSANMQISGNVTFLANVTDTNLAKVQYSIDNSTFTDMTNTTAGLYQATIDTTSLSGSSLNLTIVAFDLGGNDVSQTYDFAVNNTGLLPNANIITYKVDQAVIINDGQQDPVWTNVPETPVTEFGSGGYIKTVQDGTYLYTLLAYSSSIKWISVEFNVNSSSEVMAKGTDGWVFGTYGNTKYFGDYVFQGSGVLPVQDTKNVVFSESFSAGGMNYTETARLLTTPTTENEFQFNNAGIFNVVFASSADHTGSHTIMTWAITQASPTGSTPVSNTGKIAPTINLQQVSDYVFVFSVVIVIVTVFIHISLRVVSKPIKHERRIVYSNKIPGHPGSIPLIKRFLSEQKSRIFKPKAKTEVKKE